MKTILALLISLAGWAVSAQTNSGWSSLQLSNAWPVTVTVTVTGFSAISAMPSPDGSNWTISATVNLRGPLLAAETNGCRVSTDTRLRVLLRNDEICAAAGVSNTTQMSVAQLTPALMRAALAKAGAVLLR